MQLTPRHLFSKYSLEYLHMQCIPCFLCLRILCIKITGTRLIAVCDETWWCLEFSMQFGPCGHAMQNGVFLCLMILCRKVIWTCLKIVYKGSSFRIVLRLISLDHVVRLSHVHNSPMWKPKTPNRKKKEGTEVQRCVKWKMERNDKKSNDVHLTIWCSAVF